MENAIDVDSIISKIQIAPQFKQIFDATLVKAMRVMFEKDTHKLLLDEMDKEGPMQQKISEGVVGLCYMLFKQSNDTLPPQIVAPLALTLVLRVFQFLQKSEDPEATSQVLGDSIDMTLKTLAAKFGVPQGDIAAYAQKMKGGLLNSTAGGK